MQCLWWGLDLWAVTCYFQQCCILTSLYEPVQSHFNFRNSKCCSVSNLTHRTFKRLPKPLISLHVFTGWSESLLVAHTKLLEILCRSTEGSDELAHMQSRKSLQQLKTWSRDPASIQYRATIGPILFVLFVTTHVDIELICRVCFFIIFAQSDGFGHLIPRLAMSDAQ